jgi:lipoprotein-anchoring transpeptidase ErfK/SrfK
MKIKTISLILMLSVVGGLTFFKPVFAAEEAKPVEVAVPALKVLDSKLNQVNELNVIDKTFLGLTDFCMLDLGNDGVPEIAVSYGYQSKPSVKIYRLDGSLVNEWVPYDDKFEGRVGLGAADFDVDGVTEVVTTQSEGTGVQIKFFDGFGQPKFDGGFQVADETYTKGSEIAVGDVNGDGAYEIVVSLIGDNKNVIKIYDYFGRQMYNTIEVVDGQYYEPLKVAVYDMNGDGAAEIITGASIGNKPQINVFDYLGTKLMSAMAFGEAFLGGIDVSGATIENQPTVVATAGYSGGPHVRFYDLSGNNVFNPKFFIYDNSFRGGVNVASFDSGDTHRLAFLPQAISADSKVASFGKIIRVDISEQKLYVYDKGRLVKSFLISSGKYGFDTPYGTFHVYRKTRSARMSWNYGPNSPYNYDLPNVPHILAFYGSYTIHGAYWHHNWGHRMSHGCVNVSLSDAKWLYEWAPVGTTVIIEK